MSKGNPNVRLLAGYIPTETFDRIALYGAVHGHSVSHTMRTIINEWIGIKDLTTPELMYSLVEKLTAEWNIYHQHSLGHLQKPPLSKRDWLTEQLHKGWYKKIEERTKQAIINLCMYGEDQGSATEQSDEEAK